MSGGTPLAVRHVVVSEIVAKRWPFVRVATC